MSHFHHDQPNPIDGEDVEYDDEDEDGDTSAEVEHFAQNEAAVVGSELPQVVLRVEHHIALVNIEIRRKV